MSGRVLCPTFVWRRAKKTEICAALWALWLGKGEGLCVYIIKGNYKLPTYLLASLHDIVLLKAGGGAKKKVEVEVVMVPCPPEYCTLASFHVPLKSFAEADFTPLAMTFSKEHPPPPPVSPTTELVCAPPTL